MYVKKRIIYNFENIFRHISSFYINSYRLTVQLTCSTKCDFKYFHFFLIYLFIYREQLLILYLQCSCGIIYMAEDLCECEKIMEISRNGHPQYSFRMRYSNLAIDSLLLMYDSKFSRELKVKLYIINE